jgi:excinuclease ABC subunit A
MGPEGGDKGGLIVAQGTPEQIARLRRKNHTARFLKELMISRGNVI